MILTIVAGITTTSCASDHGVGVGSVTEIAVRTMQASPQAFVPRQGDTLCAAHTRARSIEANDLPEAMRGYLPRSLPRAFGFLLGWSDPEPGRWGAGAIWADDRCRSIRLGFYASAYMEPVDAPRVGPWRVTIDVPDQCGTAASGLGRCLEYRTNVRDGVLVISFIGFERAEADAVALGIIL